MTALPAPPQPQHTPPTLPNRHDGMYHCTERASWDTIYICALWSLIKTVVKFNDEAKEKKKCLKMAARNDFHWLRFLQIRVYHIRQS